MSCKRVILWSDLIPVCSWILLRGRCRFCSARISVQYPLVEAGTALIFMLIGAAPVAVFFKVLALPVAALFVAIAVYDLYHTIIPDLWVYICGALSLAASLVALWGSEDPYAYLIAFFAGPLAASPLFFLWLVSGGTWMGLGDVKLSLSFGWLLGPLPGLGAVFFAFILGAVVSVPLLFFSSELWGRMREFIQPYLWSLSPAGFTMKSEIPFGPFLIASCFFVWILQMYGIQIPFITFL